MSEDILDRLNRLAQYEYPCIRLEDLLALIAVARAARGCMEQLDRAELRYKPLADALDALR